MEMTKSDLFFCYDLSLQRKLKERGIKFICTAITNDEKRFWLYFRTEEVKRVLKGHMKGEN